MELAKNYILIISLVSSIIGLILIYVAAISIEPVKVKIIDITPELIGRTVTTTGNIIKRNIHPAGHLFLTISDGNADIDVPLFASFMKSFHDVGIDEKDFVTGEKLGVTGLLGEFKGQLQIQPRKVSDVKILVAE